MVKNKTQKTKNTKTQKTKNTKNTNRLEPIAMPDCHNTKLSNKKNSPFTHGCKYCWRSNDGRSNSTENNKIYVAFRCNISNNTATTIPHNNNINHIFSVWTKRQTRFFAFETMHGDGGQTLAVVLWDDGTTPRGATPNEHRQTK